MTSLSAMFSLVFVVIIGTTTAADPLTSSMTYDWTRQICCSGVVSDKSPRAYDTGCCGDDTTSTAYYYSQQLCCYDDTTNTSTLISRPSSTSYCCGTKSYDYLTQYCCNDNVYDLTQTGGWTNTYCCGDKSYDYTKQTCCYNADGNVLVDAGTSCPADPNSCNNNVGANEICCSIWDYTLQKYTYKTNDYTGITYPGCCGLDVYDYESETCCSQWNADGTLEYAVSDDPADWNWWYNWYLTPSCCGLTAYNAYTSICCSSYDDDKQAYSNIITPYPSGSQTYDFQCCGTTAYNSTTDVCCYDSELTIPKKVATTVCCGTEGYDSSNQDNQCCNDEKVYNATTQMCCGDYPDLEVVTKSDPYDNQCCGVVTYNFGKEMCCDESTGPVPRLTATTTCCGENYSGYWYWYYPYY